MACLLVLALLVSAPVTVAASDPLGKGVELMNSLTAKITAEGDAEAFKEYLMWKIGWLLDAICVKCQS